MITAHMLLPLFLPRAESIWLVRCPLAEKRRQSCLGDDFGRHTRGGCGDRDDCDSRIEIPPGRQGVDLKTMLDDG